jgi:hypothetical protein
MWKDGTTGQSRGETEIGTTSRSQAQDASQEAGRLYQRQNKHRLLLRLLRKTPKVRVENERILSLKDRRTKNGEIRSKRLDEYAESQPRIRLS